jgi:hypothetical protein
MMDIDDGYILWTGIWKGKVTLSVGRTHINADFHLLKKKPSEIPKVSIYKPQVIDEC